MSGPGGLGERWLEAVRTVARRYGIPQSELKPCVAALLDGNVGADRHLAAFVIAVECRRMGLSARATERLLRRWARSIGYGQQHVARAVRSAFLRNPDGSFKYPPPGVQKRGPVYRSVLLPLCMDVDCPRNCPPLIRRRRTGPQDEGFDRFRELGWREHLRALRVPNAVETYRAICRREQEIAWTPGEDFHVTHEQLADRAGGNRRAIARHLDLLADLGLIRYVRGSGEKGKRRSSVVGRVVPVPPPPSVPAIRAGGATPTNTGDATTSSSHGRTGP
jgi:hypothetical protein